MVITSVMVGLHGSLGLYSDGVHMVLDAGLDFALDIILGVTNDVILDACLMLSMMLSLTCLKGRLEKFPKCHYDWIRRASLGEALLVLLITAKMIKTLHTSIWKKNDNNEHMNRRTSWHHIIPNTILLHILYETPCILGKSTKTFSFSVYSFSKDGLFVVKLCRMDICFICAH